MSGRIVQPGTIETFIHYAVGVLKEPDNGETYLEVKNLIRTDMLRLDENGIVRATDRGLAYLELLCQTPIPINPFIDPRDRKEIMRERKSWPVVDHGKSGAEWLGEA